MRVLVTYASKRGGTRGLAEAVATGVAKSGHAAYLRPVTDDIDLRDYDAVIIGAALYMKQWTRSASTFVRRHRRALKQMPVWMFSSGPLDDSASRFEIPPTAMVADSMRRIGARGHRTFGGRLAPSANGVWARAMAQGGQAGDFRDMRAAAAWGREVTLEMADAIEIADGPARGGARERAEPARPSRGGALGFAGRTLATLTVFVGLTAIMGGVELMAWPQGAPWLELPPHTLSGTPFSSYFLPGLILFAAVGLPNLLTGVLALRRHKDAAWLGLFAGLSMVGWIVGELVMLAAPHWLEVLYPGVGLGTVASAAALLPRGGRSMAPAET